MTWFKQWPKKEDMFVTYPKCTKKQLDKIDSNHYAYHIVWNEYKEVYQLAKGSNLRDIQWNHIDT